MKMGYGFRKVHTKSIQLVRDLVILSDYLFWLLFDFSKFKRVDVSSIKNLLVVYSGHIGDVSNSTGILSELKSKYPDVNVYYLINKDRRNFVLPPFIKLVDRDGVKKMIREMKLDAVVLLQGATSFSELFDWELFFLINRIPYRVSCDSIQVSKKYLRRIIPLPLTRKIYTLNNNGFVQHLRCFQALGFDVKKTSFYFKKNSEEFAELFFRENKIREEEPVVFLHAGSGKAVTALEEGKVASSLWVGERWAEVGDYLIEKYGARVILTGVQKEKRVVDEIYSIMTNKKKVINLAGKVSIEDSASLLKRGDLLISIDTAMAHIGAQSGIPVIDLFGPLTPKECSPLGESTDIFHPEVCTACRKYACPEGSNVCMRAISVGEILRAADKYLKKRVLLHNI
jgi:ADP-heptose:LPS heptosyltransferase